MTEAEKFLAIIETRTFEVWYEEEFIPYIEGAEDSATRGELLDFLNSQLVRFK